MSIGLIGRKLTFWLQHLSWPGIVGLALIVGAAAYLFAIIIPAVEHGRQTRTLIAQAAVRLQVTDQADKDKLATPSEQLATFYRAFPRETSIPDWLGKIYAIADQQKLELETGEYSLTQAKSSRLDQFRIVFPVKGNYPQIRKFIGTVLATAPALALDSLTLKRDKVGDATVDGRIVFLLYLEKGE